MTKPSTVASPCSCVARSTSRAGTGPDVREPRLGIDVTSRMRDMSSIRAALGDRGSRDVVAAALDAEQQPPVAREPDGRGDVGGRGRLEDERGPFATMPFQIRTASSQPASPARSTGRSIRESSSSSCCAVSLTKPPSSPATSIVLAFTRSPSSARAGSYRCSFWSYRSSRCRSAPPYAVSSAAIGGIRPTQWLRYRAGRKPLVRSTTDVSMSAIVEDFESCYRLSDSRDPRYDGIFFVAATSTRLYCRPSCPARQPKRANVRFYPTAAAAQSAGFRACKRCRPDAAPGSPEWNWRADRVARAMRLIADGIVDREGVPGLGQAIGLQRTPSSATPRRAGWRKPGRTRARPARQHRPAPDRVDRDALRRCRIGGRVP